MTSIGDLWDGVGRTLMGTAPISFFGREAGIRLPDKRDVLRMVECSRQALGQPANIDALRFKVALFVTCASVLALLSGCGAVASNGPLTHKIIQASDNKGQTASSKSEYVFDVIEVDAGIAERVSEYRPKILRRTFGLANGAVNPRIGVGDTLQMTIFEAGPDGLFSTQEAKSTAFSVVVQPNGNAPIPYVGSFHFAGNTLEAARRAVAEKLKYKAVEPDVLINLVQNPSRTVTVNGAVGSPSIVELGVTPKRILDVVAQAGGPTGESFETFVTLTRRGKTGRTLLQNLVVDPKENMHAHPGDRLFLSKDPQTFSVLGSTGKSAKIPFQAEDVNLMEAIALASGANVAVADPKGLFVFRFEDVSVLRSVVGDNRVDDLLGKGIQPNRKGLYPVVYRVDITEPASYLIGQSFKLRNKDVVYLARHPSTDIQKFLGLIAQPIGIARGLQGI